MPNIFKQIYTFGDKLEDKARGKLSHFPILYAALGGAGVIIFWRGVWHTMDSIMSIFASPATNGMTSADIGGLPWWDGPLSIIFGMVLLLLIGLFVASFIGETIIISGLKSEKKLTEKTKEEVIEDLKETDRIRAEIHDINKRIKNIETLLTDEKKTERKKDTALTS